MDKGFENMALGLVGRGGTQMEYTRGDWKVDLTKFGDRMIIATSEDNLSHTVVADISHNFNNAEANAHLIAASKDMYEALKNAVITMASMYRLQEYTETEVIHELIPFKAALSKAEGR